MISDTIDMLLDSKGREVYSISPGESALDAIGLMARKGVGAIVVVEEDGQPVGMLTAKDYGRRVVLEGKSLKDTTVGEIMTTPVLTISPEVTVSQAMAVMARNRIRHLPVMYGGRIGGVVAIGDLARSVIADQAFTIHQLHSYVGNKYPG
jgi:CBS domain-containing protein